MSIATATPTPSTGSTPVLGFGAAAEPASTPVRPSQRHDPASAEMLARAGSPGYSWWLAHIMPAAACAHPIRLRVEAAWADGRGGSDVEHVSGDMPDQALYVACKNRRATVCPACSALYRADTYQLINAGLRGGKGVPESVAEHPCWFVTFCAPSFGPVHSVSKPGKPRPCRPRRTPETCPHGVTLACWDTHDADDPRAGQPLCRECYDYDAQAVWNLHTGELWRRSTIALNRWLAALARDLGVTVRLSYAKVAEYQHRGAVHFHALVRLDGVDPNHPEQVIPPHPGISGDHVTTHLRDVVAETSFTTAPHPRKHEGWAITWGQQLDIRTVHLTGDEMDDNGQLTTTAVAGYLAKYATKATEATGHVSRRIPSLQVLQAHTEHDSHQARQLQACWYLGTRPLTCVTRAQRDTWEHGTGKLPGWGKLQHWAHMLGYGGHFSTKTRRYSTTLTALRAVRKAFQRGQQPPPDPTDALAADADPDGAQATVIVHYTFDGLGWLTTADARLANTAAAMARERRQVAREEIEAAMTSA